MKEIRKTKLAIWTHGGVGSGLFGQGFPMIVQIIERLAVHYDICVYSASFIPNDFKVNGYTICSPSPKVKLLSFRWIYLVACFLKHHWQSRHDILYSFWGYPAGTVIVALGKLIGRPSLVNILGAETANVPEIRYGHLSGKTKRILLWTFKHATEVIAVSNYQIEKLKDAGVNREVKLIPWGADTNQFYYVSKKRELPLKILHVANLNEVKDQETLLKAFDIIRKKIPSKLQIVGGDFIDGKIQQLANQLNLQNDVEFIGAVPHMQIAPYYHWADVFMLTSLSEGQNNSITEAMTCGILPASTAVGIMYQLQECGVVVEPKDFKGLSTQLIELYADETEWELRRKAALTWATNHNLTWTINELVSVIDSVR